MSTSAKAKIPVCNHGSDELPAVQVTSYNLEARDGDGFVGDKAKRDALVEHLDDLRTSLRRNGDDPLKGPSAKKDKKELDALLLEGSPNEAALILSAVEDYAQSLAFVIRRFLKFKAWSNVERIAAGGGLRHSRVGELAIGRAGIILKSEGYGIELAPTRNHPDEAGLIGCAHLAPNWMFEGFDSIAAIDIGGSNIRAGIVELRQEKSADLSKARVYDYELWRHADEQIALDQTVKRLGKMLNKQIKKAIEAGLKVAPFVGIGCPGLIEANGTIERGAQNLPGNWEGPRFNLVDSIKDMVPKIGEHETFVTMHNDAVIQGLSELPAMQDVESWAILTIGTGLGNATFLNRRAGRKQARTK